MYDADNMNLPKIDLNLSPEEMDEIVKKFDACIKPITEEELIEGILNQEIPGYIDANGKPVVLR